MNKLTVLVKKSFDSLKGIRRRLPWWAAFAAGPALGALSGIAAGLPGVLIGITLGALLQTIIRQFSSDRKILSYYENPGSSNFFEAEPGLAAFCGLCVIISVPESDGGEAGLEETVRGAAVCFPGADRGLVEYFCRMAFSRRKELNLDLLAESLAARRKSRREDTPDLGYSLRALARGEKSRELAEQILVTLGSAASTPESENKTAWKILGLAPGTPRAELKSHFRRLAMQFHPDELQVLDEERRQTAARAFITLERAYKEALEQG